MSDLEPESEALIREWQDASPRKPRAHPEHDLQVQIRLAVREVVAAPHLFLAFDRSRKQSQFQHAREKARGLRRGTPDTVLLVEGKALWCEIKAPGNRPDEHQHRVGDEIRSAGGMWLWASSVTGYLEQLREYGVSLRPNAELVGQHRDGLLAAPPRAPKRRAGPAKEKPTHARVRRTEAMRSRIRF